MLSEYQVKKSGKIKNEWRILFYLFPLRYPLKAAVQYKIILLNDF